MKNACMAMYITEGNESGNSPRATQPAEPNARSNARAGGLSIVKAVMKKPKKIVFA